MSQSSEEHYDCLYGYSYPEGETKVTFPDYLLPFGEFWNGNVRFTPPDDRVIPVEYPHLEEQLSAYGDVTGPNNFYSFHRDYRRKVVSVREDDRISPRRVRPWEEEYPWLAKSDIRVIDESKPPLYQLFSGPTAQVGVGSMAMYEGLCFYLETLVFDTDGSYVLRPHVKDGAASMIANRDELSLKMDAERTREFDWERFFKPYAAENILQELNMHLERR